MVNRLNQVSIVVYITVLSMCAALKREARVALDDERGSVVEYVLLAMVAIMAVAALWNIMRPWISDMWRKITAE